MKMIIAAIAIAFTSLTAYNAVWAADDTAGPKTEKVCNKTTDSKGKEKEVCKRSEEHTSELQSH